MAVGPVVRARHGRDSSAEMRDLQSRDPEDLSWGGKAAGDTLLLGIPSNKRLALLVTAVALVCLLFFMPGRSGDDGDLAERRAGGSERLDHSPLLSDGFDRTAVAPLPHTTGTGKGSYGGVKAAEASSSLHHLPSSAASSSLHRASSAPSAPGRAPSPKAAPSPVAKNSLGTDASKKGTLLNSVHSIADSKKKLMPPAEQDDEDDDDKESPMDENEDGDEDGDEEGQGIDEDDEDDEGDDDDDDDDDDIVEHEDEEDRRSEEEMTEYANVMFDKMDKNENGRVSWKEYHKVIKHDADFEDETTAEQKEDFDEIDTNKDGYISRDEMIRDWLRDDLDYGDGEEDDDEDDEDDDDADEDEGGGDEDGGDEEGEGKVGASKDSALPTSAKTKATVGAKTTAAGSGVGGAGKATSQPSAGKGKTLGESIKDVALKMFRGRAPKPRSINVMLYQANQVSWMAAEEHCRKQHKKICPMKAIQQLKLCRDTDPKHKGRSTPLDRPGTWVTLDTCKEEQHGGDAAKKALIACC